MANRNDNEKNVILNFFAGLGLGALIGAATALLMAPKAGSETREDLKGAANDLRTKADKMAHDLSESSQELVKKSKELLDVTKDRVQSAIETGKQAMAQKQQDISEEHKEPTQPGQTEEKA